MYNRIRENNTVSKGEINGSKNGNSLIENNHAGSINGNGKLTNGNSISLNNGHAKWLDSKGEYYKVLVENSHDIITVLDKKGNMLYYSPSAKNILGYSDKELINESVFDYIFPEDFPAVMKTFYDSLTNPGKKVTVELRFRKADGTYAYLETVGTNWLDDPKVNGIVLNSRDITKRKIAESENLRLKTAVEQSYESIVVTDIDGNIEYVNNKFVEVTGYSREEAMGKNPRILKSGFSAEEDYKKLWETISRGDVWEGEFKNKKKNGEYYWESARITPVKNSDGKVSHYIAIKNDISELKSREDELVKALDEKEIILRETHHRVKNNFQIISSLLKLQSESVNDPELKAYLRASTNRIKSMALIHQQLYNSPDLRSINIEEYLYSLSGQIYSTFNITPDKIGFKVFAKDISLNVETAVPFGLIASELISNSLRHAFAKRQKGMIIFEIEKGFEEDSYKLVYKDDGIGIPYEYVNGSSDSSGIFLINTLANQLNGKVKLENKLGTIFEIEFKEAVRHSLPRVNERRFAAQQYNVTPPYNHEPVTLPYTKV